MDRENHSLTLYTAQSDTVLQVLRRDGACYSRQEYVARKYGESSKVFLTAYNWFVKAAAEIVPKPPEAELPYWAFQDLYSLDTSGGNVLMLLVPANQVVLFDLYSWNKVLCMKYLAETAADERAFSRELSLRGLQESDVMLTGFYPDLRQRILDSWPRLLRHHYALLAGDTSGVGSVQAGLWQLRAEWVQEGLF